MKLTKEQYLDHHEEFNGYCKECDDVTRFGETEPDAEEYECPACEENSCYGVEQALVRGYIEIVDSEDDSDQQNDEDIEYEDIENADF